MFVTPAGNTRAWTLGPVTFRLHVGDMFDLPGDYVNSEDSAFLLSRDGKRVSGQIFRRWGRHVQPALDRLTGGRNLPAGTVLETDVPDGGLVYHAGFHHPDAWLDPAGDAADAGEHVQMIRLCIRDILQRARRRPTRPLVFPLIGCGVFSLDPHLLAYELFSELAAFAREPATPPMEVYLAVLAPALEPIVLRAGAQAWADEMPWPPVRTPLGLGVALLDDFERAHVLRASDPHSASWMQLRFAEIVTSYLLALLATGRGSVPEALFDEERSLTFGTVRAVAEKLAKGGDLSPWGAFAAKHFEPARLRTLGMLVEQRNHLAHGRASVDANQIRELLQEWLLPTSWIAEATRRPSPAPRELFPWIAVCSDTGAERVGVLSGMRGQERVYIAPSTGRPFRLPRSLDGSPTSPHASATR